MKNALRTIVAVDAILSMLFYVLGNTQATRVTSLIFDIIFGVAGIIYLWRD